MFRSLQLARILPNALLLPILVASFCAASAQSTSTRSMPSADRTALQGALQAYDQGHPQQAESVLLKLAPRYPASYEVNEALGSLYAEADQLDRALPYLERSCRIAPRDALAHANLGAVYLRLFKVGEAVRELQLAATLDAKNGQTQANLGQALMRAKQPSAAAKAFAMAVSHGSDTSDLRYNLALALYQNGRSKEAVAALDAIPATAMTAEMHALAGDCEERDGNFLRALDHFEAAARMEASDANLYALTLELLRHWNWEEAIKVADYGTSRYPESPHFRLAAGIAYYAKNDYPPAVQVFSALLKQDPSDASVADLLGRSCTALQDGQNEGCRAVFDYAQKHPGNAVMMTYGAIAMLHATEEEQHLDQAATMLQQAIAADPRYPEAYLRMGVVEQMRLHWAASATLLEKAIALDPKSAEAHYRLSRAYFRLGRKDEAQQQLALRESCAKEAKQTLDAKMQEVMRFVLSPG